MQIHVKPRGLRRVAMIGAVAAVIAGLAGPALAQNVPHQATPYAAEQQQRLQTGSFYNGNVRGARAQERASHSRPITGAYGGNPFECLIDEGYGRWSACDNE